MDGQDIVVRDCTASCFGDAADVRSGQDNGVGASGFRYWPDHPDYIGIALPMRCSGIRSLRKSPLPKLPWYWPVRVFAHETGKSVIAHVIDYGPTAGLDSGAAIDLLPATVAALGLKWSKGLWQVDYRCIGAAKYMPK